MTVCRRQYGINTIVMIILYMSIIIGLIIHIYYDNKNIVEGIDNSTNNLSQTNSHNITVLNDKFSTLETKTNNMSKNVDNLLTPVLDQCCRLNKKYLCNKCKQSGFRSLPECKDNDYCNRCDILENKNENKELCKTQGVCKPCKGGSDNISYSCC